MQNIIEFYRARGLDFWPRQRLMLKLFYHLPLDMNELAEMRVLLRNGHTRREAGGNPYARVYFPGIGAESINLATDVITDQTLREVLLDHQATNLVLILGRRAGGSVINKAIAGYEAARLKADTAAQPKDILYGVIHEYHLQGVMDAILSMAGLTPRTPTDKRHHLQVFLQMFAEHTRGRQAQSVHLDDLTLLQDGGEDCWHALTFQVALGARVVVTTNPTFLYTPAGREYYLARLGRNARTIVGQFATWEMNPGISFTSPTLTQARETSAPSGHPHHFETEFGAQWVEDVLYDALLSRLPGHVRPRSMSYA